jgi:hypothetical protein
VLAGAIWVGKSRAPRSTVSSAATAATTAQDQSVRVRVTVDPPNATVMLDGVPVASPYEATQHRSSEPHLFHVEAAGYEPQTRTVAFDDNVALVVALTKSAPASATPTAAAVKPPIAPARGGGRWTPPAKPGPDPAKAPGSTAPTVSTAAATAATPKAPSSIDTGDPWGGGAAKKDPNKTGIDTNDPWKR